MVIDKALRFLILIQPNDGYFLFAIFFLYIWLSNVYKVIALNEIINIQKSVHNYCKK
jgi:hypothetical protein